MASATVDLPLPLVPPIMMTGRRDEEGATQVPVGGAV